MKRLIIAAALFSMVSCKVPQVYLSMAETEFKTQHRAADMVETSASGTIYKEFQYSDVERKNLLGVKFYYFVDGKLTKMDEGQNSGYGTIKDRVHS